MQISLNCPLSPAIGVAPPRELHPFDHQVAGQSLIMRYDATTICKSLISREHKFYLTLNESLKPCVPQYKGVVQLHIPDRVEYSKEEYPPHIPQSSTHQYIAPNQIRGLRKSSKSGITENGALYDFLLLEDLISKFEHPCVLDLKIGTRQHGDDAPPDKVAYQVNKCKTTTSASLGIRLCGMKKFLPSTEQYDIKDKDDGRRLTDDDMKAEVTSFLSTNGHIRWDLVLSLLHHLRHLRSIIEKLDGYRFFSCSLLVVYEGDPRIYDDHILVNKREHHKSGTCAVVPNVERPESCTGSLLQMESNGESGSTGSNASSIGSVKHEKRLSNSGEYTCNSDHDVADNLSMRGRNREICCAHTKIDTTFVKEEVGFSNASSPIAQCVRNRYKGCAGRSKGTRKTTTSSVKEADSVSEIVCSCSVALDSLSKAEPEARNNNLCLKCENTSSGDLKIIGQTVQPESCESLHNLECVDVRVVDFAHATCPGFELSDTVQHLGPDRGFLTGLTSLEEILTEVSKISV